MSTVASLTVTDFDIHFLIKDTLARHHTPSILEKKTTASQVVIKFQDQTTNIHWPQRYSNEQKNNISPTQQSLRSFTHPQQRRFATSSSRRFFSASCSNFFRFVNMSSFPKRSSSAFFVSAFGNGEVVTKIVGEVQFHWISYIHLKLGFSYVFSFFLLMPIWNLFGSKRSIAKGKSIARLASFTSFWRDSLVTRLTYWNQPFPWTWLRWACGFLYT